MSAFRVGLVGAGSIAQIAELPALTARADVELVGVVTKTMDGSEAVARKWGIARCYESAPAMVDDADLDALFVLTPKQLHTPFVELGLRSGLDVFCEKPLTTSVDESRALAQLADDTGRVLMVGFNRRYAEVYQIAHEHLSGDTLRFAVAQKNRPGSEYRATLENAIHMVDLLRWFAGESSAVDARTIAPDPWAETGTAALLSFGSGAIATLVAARCAGEWDERLDLYGDLTTVRVKVPDWVEISAGGTTRRVDMTPRASGWPSTNITMGFGPEVDHFFTCVTTRERPLTDGHEACRTQELMEQILASAGLPLADQEQP